MKFTQKYILNQFLNTNLSMFFVLFSIVSMVFFIQLAKLTSSINIQILDLLWLYMFMLPRILIFTLPISFFIALSISLYRLSRENELLVIFALGFSPKNLAKFFLKLSAFVSFFMLFISWVVLPITLELQENFVNFKKTQTQFYYKSGEIGQKISNWLLFIEKQDENEYQNITIYNPQDPNLKEHLISAKKAHFENANNVFTFVLQDGQIYNFNDEQNLLIGNFQTLSINFQSNSNTKEPLKFYEYYKNISNDEARAREFVLYTCISLFPLASALFALSFGIVNFRYQKGFIYPGMAGVCFMYFGLLGSFYTPPLLCVALIFTGSFAFSLIFFKKIILNRY